MLYWYHFFINNPGVIRLANMIWQVWYWKRIVMQAGMYIKMYNKCLQLKNRKTLYELPPLNNIESLKPWNLVHINLVGPYTKSKIKHHPGGAITKKYLILDYIAMIDPATGWFKIIKVPWFDINEAARGNIEHVDKLPARVSHLFNKTFLYM